MKRKSSNSVNTRNASISEKSIREKSQTIDFKIPLSSSPRIEEYLLLAASPPPPAFMPRPNKVPVEGRSRLLYLVKKSSAPQRTAQPNASQEPTGWGRTPARTSCSPASERR